MEERRKQFTFYRSFWESVQVLPKKDRLPILEAIISYALDGDATNITLSGKQNAVFTDLVPVLITERRASLEGRRSVEYKKWRTSVFERDNYTCQMCGSRGVRINAHHIRSYAHFTDVRYDIGNGITLCISCHKAVHRMLRNAGKQA